MRIFAGGSIGEGCQLMPKFVNIPTLPVPMLYSSVESTWYDHTSLRIRKMCLQLHWPPTLPNTNAYCKCTQ